ncbi:MAG TPA: hypothetical protein VMV81_14350, partial [Phycisphaerae bacterium]|nr:hypothetical protein [Phycisphaerae bacterium]
ACNTVPDAVPSSAVPAGPPTDMTVVTGGISDVRPFFGTTTGPDGTANADFLLATCGCGYWRILIQNTDGSQVQFPINFYTDNTYVPTGSVTVFGRDENGAALGSLDQDGGTVGGRVELSKLPRQFSAVRGDAHSQEVKACVMCHVGDNPIYPRPANHPVQGVSDCFQCHNVVIK